MNNGVTPEDHSYVDQTDSDFEDSEGPAIYESQITDAILKPRFGRVVVLKHAAFLT
jgi:hypothetical protein